MEEKISIIIPAYNAELYIEEALNSILNQTYKNIEVIVCDDNSKDKTWEIIQHYSDLDNRVIALKNEINLKAAATRNKCIQHSTGTYIAIQDADDYSDLNRLEKQVKILKESKYDFVGSWMYLVNESGEFGESIRKELPIKEDFIEGLPFCHGTLIFQKEVLEKCNGYKVSKYTQRGQDADLIMRAYAYGFRGYNIQEPLYYYRLDNAAISRRSIKSIYYACIVRYQNLKKLKLLPRGYFSIIKLFVYGLYINFYKSRRKV
ncbi:glycosyltransferase family 2 protein [Bhargavaea ginsengi]|uniref:glycosyltransferase family 2 protein n=1 Tax=Bhargavaea ginsengi TaxID=426757 RepID=UPI003C763E58